MALWRKKPVSPEPFDAVLIDGNYYYAGSQGVKMVIPQGTFETENEQVPLVKQG
jgi:hypothetical protein